MQKKNDDWSLINNIYKFTQLKLMNQKNIVNYFKIVHLILNFGDGRNTNKLTPHII